jgi:hypothetical protein
MTAFAGHSGAGTGGPIGSSDGASIVKVEPLD